MKKGKPVHKPWFVVFDMKKIFASFRSYHAGLHEDETKVRFNV